MLLAQERQRKVCDGRQGVFDSGAVSSRAVMTTYARILVPVDLGEQSQQVLQHAKAIADRFGSSLDLLYCFPNPVFPDATGLINPFSPELIEKARRDTEQELERLLTAAERDRYRSRSVAVVGDPLEDIVAYAKREDIDLIVMGTHGRKGLTHMFLGSVAERVVRAAPCPVLTVH